MRVHMFLCTFFLFFPRLWEDFNWQIQESLISPGISCFLNLRRQPIFARYFELSDVRDSGKSGQATRLAVFRGSAARLSLKATKYPECIHRALNPGAIFLQSLQSHSLVVTGGCMVPSHSWHRFCNACLEAGFPKKSCFSWSHLFVCVSVSLPLKCWSCSPKRI